MVLVQFARQQEQVEAVASSTKIRIPCDLGVADYTLSIRRSVAMSLGDGIFWATVVASVAYLLPRILGLFLQARAVTQSLKGLAGMPPPEFDSGSGDYI